MALPRPAFSRLRETSVFPLLKAVQEQAPRERSLRRKRMDFYRQIVHPGSLVFDIGANVGNRVQVFLALDATVIALEPQPFCVKTLRRRWGHDPRLTVLPIGVSDAPGIHQLFQASEHGLTTMLPEYMERMAIAGNRWKEGPKIRVVTMDALMTMFGLPDFVKIDVEGFEPRVLAGMSTPAPMLSFEVNPQMIDGALQCFDHLERFPYEYSFSAGEEMVTWGGWISSEEMISRLKSDEQWGDVYARLSTLGKSKQRVGGVGA